MNEKLVKLWETKNKNDEWWSSFVTSPLAVLANLVVVDFKWLSPNLITLFSFIVGLAAAFLILVGTPPSFYIAAVLIHVSHILDCMDGQMARYRGTSSRSGGFFDKVTDQAQVFFGSERLAMPLMFKAMMSCLYSLPSRESPSTLCVDTSNTPRCI